MPSGQIVLTDELIKLVGNDDPVSALAANISTLMLDLKYSRNAERAADDYANAMLKENGIALSSMIEGFEKLEKASPDHNPYLSSHPATAERIERIRQAQRTP